MRVPAFFLLAILFSSCWKWKVKLPPDPTVQYIQKNVWGNKPVYLADSIAKKIAYIDTAQPVLMPGNIYAKGNYIFQVDIGKGMHIIDNTVPSSAHRIGFISINGCTQVAIKGNSLYSNSYDDLVSVDISDPKNVKEIIRIRGALPEGRFSYTYFQPTETGYFECPKYDSIVIGWRKDSIRMGCYKN